MTHYNIHNLIEVLVEPTVPPALRSAIDFQIAHFRNDGAGVPDADRIHVHPYRDSPGRPDGDHAFHLCRGGDGEWIEDPRSRTVYRRDSRGFQVYADTPAMLINMLIQFLLVRRGITLVHAAAVADTRGAVTLLPGPGGVGKTALLGEWVKKHGLKLLGDDIVAVSLGGMCYSFPRSFVLKAYHQSVFPEVFRRLHLSAGPPPEGARFSGRFARRTLNLLVDNMPFKGAVRHGLRKLGLLSHVRQSLAEPRPPAYLATVPVEEVFGPGCVAASGPIERIVFLERWATPNFTFDAMPADAMARRLFAIIHHEWVGHMLHFWTLGSMEVIDLGDYFQRMSRILDHVVADLPCARMRIPESAGPDELMRFFTLHQHQPIPEQKAA